MVKRIKEIPSWFDVTNYQSFKELDDKNLMEEFYYRRRNYREILNNPNGLRSKFHMEPVLKGSPSILNHRALTHRYLEESDHNKGFEKVECYFSEFPLQEEIHTDSDNVFRLINAGDLLSLTESIDDKIRLENGCEATIDSCLEVNISKWSQFLDFSIDSIRYTPPDKRATEGYAEKIHLSFDLKKLTDTEIVERLKAKLPVWRKELETEEPEWKYELIAKEAEINKITSYEVFALQDLFIWQKIKNIKIADSTIVDSIYSNSVSEKKYRDTRLTFFHRIFETNFFHPAYWEDI